MNITINKIPEEMRAAVVGIIRGRFSVSLKKGFALIRKLPLHLMVCQTAYEDLLSLGVSVTIVPSETIDDESISITPNSTKLINCLKDIEGFVAMLPGLAAMSYMENMNIIHDVIDDLQLKGD